MMQILIAYLLGVLTSALGMLACQERRLQKRRLGYPRRGKLNG